MSLFYKLIPASILLFILFACEGNINMSSENSSSNEKNISTNSTTIINRDTSITKSDHNETDYKEDKNKTNINFNIKDNSGITEQLEKQLRQENNDTTAPTNQNKTTLNTNIRLKSKIDCQESISGDDFENLKEQINEEHMDSDKLKKAKSLFNQNCMTSKQAREICSIFMLDDTRLEMAKFAYGRTTDKDNYLSKFSKVFSFRKTYDQLEEFVMD